MDIAALGSLLGSIKTATEIAKLIRESDSSLERAETKLKLADLVSALAEAKLNAAEVQEAILERDAEIRRLLDEARLTATLIWRQPCYFLSNADGKEEPFCQNCYDTAKKLAHLHDDGRGQFHCRVCKERFSTAERAQADAAAFTAPLRKRGSGFMGSL